MRLTLPPHVPSLERLAKRVEENDSGGGSGGGQYPYHDFYPALGHVHDFCVLQRSLSYDHAHDLAHRDHACPYLAPWHDCHLVCLYRGHGSLGPSVDYRHVYGPCPYYLSSCARLSCVWIRCRYHKAKASRDRGEVGVWIL